VSGRQERQDNQRPGASGGLGGECPGPRSEHAVRRRAEKWTKHAELPSAVVEGHSQEVPRPDSTRSHQGRDRVRHGQRPGHSPGQSPELVRRPPPERGRLPCHWHADCWLPRPTPSGEGQVREECIVERALTGTLRQCSANLPDLRKIRELLQTKKVVCNLLQTGRKRVNSRD